MEPGDRATWSVSGTVDPAPFLAGPRDTAGNLVGPFREAWCRPLAAGRQNVDIWFVPVGTHQQLADLARVLGQADWAAIARVRDFNSRDHLRATRIALRLALSHATVGAVAPSGWRFQSTSYGKPHVAPGLPDVHCCVSHTDTMSVIAVSLETPVGIDIETIGSATDDKTIAAVCSTRERRGLLRLPQSQQQRAFARLWTLKEAYSKLTGTGLATDFKSLVFQVDPEQQTAGHVAQHRSGEISFLGWLAESPGGLCQVSVAFYESNAVGEGGELVCFAPGTPTLEPGRGVQMRPLLC